MEIKLDDIIYTDGINERNGSGFYRFQPVNMSSLERQKIFNIEITAALKKKEKYKFPELKKRIGDSQ